ncbi:MAG: ArsB/NhaD family transporter [Lentisphaerae bacterium]|nr:ArsB/NhaD family transporter [Lentisphaerota bacterium]
MLLPILIFAVVYIFIATELVDKTIAALVGAGLVIALHTVPYEEALHAIDLNVIFLLTGMMGVVSILSETGLFEWLSIRIAKLTHGNGLYITVLFLLLTAVLSALLDNVTTVILMAPVTILIAQLLEIPATPILILEAIFSNIGGTATLIGDPPNILIGSQTELVFSDFLVNLGPIIVIITFVVVAAVIALLRTRLNASPATRSRVSRSRPERAILQPDVLKKALLVFAFILAGFLCGRVLDIEPGIVALVGAVVMAQVCGINIHKLFARVEWNTIFFFVGLFIMIAALEHHGVFEGMGQLILRGCHGNLMLTAFAILWFSAVASAIVDNIPLVMAMIPLVKGIIPVFAASMGLHESAAIHVQIAEPLLWSLALGACLGGNGSIVGASANVVIAQVAARNKCPISFGRFAAYGIPITLGSVLLSNLYIYLRYFVLR